MALTNRLPGKSVFTDGFSELLSERDSLLSVSRGWDGMTSTISGTRGDVLGVDEVYDWEETPQATFENTDYPMATVKVWSETLPLVSNAPLPVTVYVIEAGGRRSAPHRNYDLVLDKAKDLHQRMIEALVAEMRKDLPNFGRFS